MNLAKAVVVVVAVCFLTVSEASAQKQKATATQEVTGLLNEFMDAAGRSDRAVFDKFFADDVIYTRATGVVTTKAEIMANVGKPGTATDGKTAYSAEDITVHEYGEMAVVAFRLVGRATASDGKTVTSFYRNTGTFLRRNGKWQAVAWQATKVSEAAKTQ